MIPGLMAVRAGGAVVDLGRLTRRLAPWLFTRRRAASTLLHLPRHLFVRGVLWLALSFGFLIIHGRHQLSRVRGPYQPAVGENGSPVAETVAIVSNRHRRASWVP
jgi:hypothetical protein